MKRQRRILRTVDALKNIADIRKEFESDKGMHRRLGNIAKVILFNLHMEERKLVTEGLKGHPVQFDDGILNAEDPYDVGLDKGVDPRKVPFHQPASRDDSDIEQMLAEQGPTEAVFQMAQRRAKEIEIRAMLAASRRLEDVIPHADPRTLAQLAYPLMRSGGVMRDREPPPGATETPPAIRVKMSDGRVLELGKILDNDDD